MSFGAIVAVDPIGQVAEQGPYSRALTGISSGAVSSQPLACIEVLGRSVLERMIDRYLAAGAEAVTVLAEAETATQLPPYPGAFQKVAVQVVSGLDFGIAEKLSEYWHKGIEHAFVSSANEYAETDLLDLFYFHRESRQAITRAYNREGSLGLWAVDCEKAHCPNPNSFAGGGGEGGSYFAREYANHLAHPRDLRRFAEDILRGRCECRPSGRQSRPGIWIDERAEIHRGARIVAPAYIGCGAKVFEDAVVTRYSNIERDCQIDCGTVIQDSSILANTHVGIWLDVCNAVVSGNRMWSLERDVMVEISDPNVMRASSPVRVSRASEPQVRQRNAAPLPADLPEERPTAAIWQFGASAIQE